MKECYYSILQVDSKATFDEIRQAYKQLSLKWHPDKNRGNTEEATQRFQSISAAYEVLSDPNERSWYDSHKKQILSENKTGNTYENDPDYDPLEINIWKYFSREVFEDFNDERLGFFTVYGKLFEEILQEELKYLSKESGDYLFWKNANKFGNGRTNLEEVMEFYRFWSNFSSMRTFSWKDIWNLNQAQNRQMKRAMEAENNKERKKGKREYNETVRRLVEYVKKRDPRVVMYMRNKSEQMLRLQKEKEKEKKIEMETRRKAREIAKIEELKRMEELEAERRELYGEDSSHEFQDSEELDEIVIYTCRLCNKTFKSEKQLISHTKSKKHISKVNEFKKESFEKYENRTNSTEKTHSENTDHSTPNKSLDVYSQNSVSDSALESNCHLDSDSNSNSNEILSNSNRSGSDTEDYELGIENGEQFSVDQITEMMDSLSNKRGFKGKQREFERVGLGRQGGDKKNNKDKRKEVVDNIGNKKQVKNVPKDDNSKNQNVMWKCLVCDQIFESRNKLFTHVKEKNHAQIKSSSNYKKSKVKQ
ncbi:DnaJ domain-containing protein [Cryptosporidium felis]|nr:DnaJ domain-containing protein [Cryptosporidium felis]